MEYCCERMQQILEDEEGIICYYPSTDEYGIVINADSCYHIIYCPWCGKKLPESKRMQWFSELEKLGFESPLFEEKIPEEYKSDKWWKK